MGQVKTCAQTYGHGYRGFPGTGDQGFTDGVEDNESGVTENRDGYDPAHELQSQNGMILAHQVNDHVRQLEGGAGHFQNGADQGAQNDDDTDAGEGPGKAGSDDAGKACDLGPVLQGPVHDGDPCHKAEDQGNSHDGNKGMDLEL